MTTTRRARRTYTPAAPAPLPPVNVTVRHYLTGRTGTVAFHHNDRAAITWSDGTRSLSTANVLDVIA